ncbi:hypothetical protein EYC84_009732 [Monilinia fructicola]|uniref:Flavin-nucleotide-binding protein n=1 Tax=Monilinia fructicola TaxID=38448 RepID=A0A5M9J9M6_MONFR|nr:hypothetical protein EYC84_009732 [Monilinia fructicola]
MANLEAEAEAPTCYPKMQRNTVQRYRARANYNHKTIHTIINSSPILHVSFHTPDPEDPFPATLPMLGFMGIYSPSSFSTSASSQDQHHDAKGGDGEGEDVVGEGAQLYLHGYVSSRLMRMGKSASEGGTGEDGEGLPMTVAASCLDGLVLALTPNSHSYNYRSAILQGYGQIVEDVDEKLWAMKKITNTVIHERWENTRVPPTKTEMTNHTNPPPNPPHRIQQEPPRPPARRPPRSEGRHAARPRVDGRRARLYAIRGADFRGRSVGLRGCQNT